MAKRKNQPASAATEPAGGPSVAAHPRAGRYVNRAKGWGGLIGFAIAGLASLQAGVPAFEVGLRALIAGVACYLVAWAVAVAVWRHLVVAEMHALEERLQAQHGARRKSDDAAAATARATGS